MLPFNHRPGHTTSLLSRVVVLLTVTCSATALACQVPVFRYALERWNADRYRITVVHNAPLNESQAAALARLKRATEINHGTDASVHVQVVDVGKKSKDKLSPAMLSKWRSHNDPTTPLLLVDYPRGNDVGRTEPMYQDALTESAVESILD